MAKGKKEELIESSLDSINMALKKAMEYIDVCEETKDISRLCYGISLLVGNGVKLLDHLDIRSKLDELEDKIEENKSDSLAKKLESFVINIETAKGKMSNRPGRLSKKEID